MDAKAFMNGYATKLRGKSLQEIRDITKASFNVCFELLSYYIISYLHHMVI